MACQSLCYSSRRFITFDSLYFEQTNSEHKLKSRDMDVLHMNENSSYLSHWMTSLGINLEDAPEMMCNPELFNTQVSVTLAYTGDVC